MAKQNILVVDDEEDIRELISMYLTRERYGVLECDSGEEALDRARRQTPDLIVLDLMLPGIDGLEVCKRLKSDAKTEAIPVVMVTAKGEEADVVTGLELGADDYVTKPFSAKILIARIRRLLRRRPEAQADHAALQFDSLKIDPDRREVTLQGKVIRLTFTEFNILHTLAKRAGSVFTRYKIVDAIHGNDYLVTDRAVDVQIVALRKKLGPVGHRIETVRGVGYRFRD